MEHGDTHTPEQVLRRGIEYYTELFLFLLAAMTFVNAMGERQVFLVLSKALVSRGGSLRRVYWLIPALFLSFLEPRTSPEPIRENVDLLPGAGVIVGLFVLAIVMAVSVEHFLYMPAVLGMMTGLGFLKLYGYHLKRQQHATGTQQDSFDIFRSLEHAEWDTLMFFYGIILCVGGLGTLGYLGLLSESMYGDLGPTTANIAVGFLSALIDNIPVMFAVLTMMPDMNEGQWLLVTLTAGVGGSMLSIGSAAGVAVMGQARGIYTFFAHLKWSWAISLGYAASIWVHFLVNAGRFS